MSTVDKAGARLQLPEQPGTSIAKFAPNASATGFYDAQYGIPANLISGKNKVTVKFHANGNGRIAPVFRVRTIRPS